MKGLESGAAITEGPESSGRRRKLITGVRELPQLGAVDTSQPQESAKREREHPYIQQQTLLTRKRF